MNIVEYIENRGDLSLNTDPFNEVDNLVISYAIYSKIDSYFEKKKTYTVKQLSKAFFKDHTIKEIEEDHSFIGQAPFILKAMAESNRFQNAIIKNFVSTIDEENAEQFCSYEMVLDDGTSYIAFRGTDDSLIGWKESLSLSFKEVSGERKAVEYLKKYIKKDHKYRIGGHSKGGTLAIYGALLVPELHSNIINVYSNDGPGLNPAILPKNYHDNFETLKGKYIKIIPEYDFFGVIFSSTRKKIVIKSDAFALMQHDGMTWQIKGNKFVRGTLNKESQYNRKAFNDFLRSIDKEQRKQFIDEFYNACTEKGIDSVDGILRGIVPIMFAALTNFSKMSDESKEAASKLIEVFATQYKNMIIDDTISFTENTKKKAINMIKKIGDRFDIEK